MALEYSFTASLPSSVVWRCLTTISLSLSMVLKLFLTLFLMLRHLTTSSLPLFMLVKRSIAATLNSLFLSMSQRWFLSLSMVPGIFNNSLSAFIHCLEASNYYLSPSVLLKWPLSPTMTGTFKCSVSPLCSSNQALSWLLMKIDAA